MRSPTQLSLEYDLLNEMEWAVYEEVKQDW